MSLNINNIYCSQLLINEELKKSCENNKHPRFFVKPHDVLHIKDSINYKAIYNNDFTTYNHYITQTKQLEHSVENFKNLIKNFDVKKMQPIQLKFNYNIKKYVIQDGVHRLCILLHKKIYNNEIPIKKFNIIYDNNTILKVKEQLLTTTGRVFSNKWHNNTTYGYHSFNFYNINIPGQRNPVKRLGYIKKFIDFKNKSVLDFGCNSGGMLLHLPEIKKGFGYDFNPDCIKSAEFMNNILQFNDNLTFIQKDLNDVNFPELENTKVDIIFLLALGSWIKNWRELYTFSIKKSKTIIYETNNDMEARPQLKLFRDFKCDISIISAESDDDITNNLGRKTYLIKCP